MPGRIVVFGATGYTGRLVVEELATRRLPAVLAARNAERLAEVRERVGGIFTVAVADASDPASIKAVLQPGDVLISTVGPFVRFGEAALEAAMARRAHYIDSTGEPPFIRHIFEDCGQRARRRGVSLVTAFGYDCVPGNLAAALALTRAGPSAVAVDVGYFAAGGRPSDGTVASMLGIARAPQFSWRDGRLVTERAGMRMRSFNLGRRDASGLSFGGSEHFAVPRVTPSVRTVGTYLGWFGPATRAVQAMTTGAAALEKLPGVTAALGAAMSRLAPQTTGGGPDATQRARMRAIFAAIAMDANGHELSSVRLSGIDPYTLTARLLVAGARRLRDTPGDALPAGAIGPLEAFSLPELLRVNADAGLRQVR